MFGGRSTPVLQVILKMNVFMYVSKQHISQWFRYFTQNPRTPPSIHNSKSAHKSRTYCTIFFGYKRICINISKLFPYCKATHGCSLIFLAWHWKTRNIRCLLHFIRSTQGFRRKTGGKKLTKFVWSQCLIFIRDHSHSSPFEGTLC